MAVPENVEISGDINFDKYLAIDGTFEGTIITSNEVIFKFYRKIAILLCVTKIVIKG